jgi:putative FmdB family regulatory protein
VPLYDYHCNVCKNEFEVDQSINDKPEAECPQCRVMTSNRLLGRSTFVLKGDGWAKDNYSKKV